MGSRNTVICLIAAVVVLAAGIYLVTSRSSSLLIASGTTHVIRGGSASSEGVQMSSAGTISGAYSSNSTLDFYIMTDTQYSGYQGGEFGTVVLARGSELAVPSRSYSYESMNVSRAGSLSGEFAASDPVSFYLLTPAQFSTYNQTGSAPNYVYVGSGTDIIISMDIQAGSYYAVFEAGTSSSTTVVAARPVQIAYAVPASDYVYESSTPGAFSVNVGQGKYDLVWINPQAGNANLVITQDIKAS